MSIILVSKLHCTLDFVFPVRDLMTRELEIRPMDEGEKLTWTGSSFCRYNKKAITCYISLKTSCAPLLIPTSLFIYAMSAISKL